MAKPAARSRHRQEFFDGTLAGIPGKRWSAATALQSDFLAQIQMPLAAVASTAAMPVSIPTKATKGLEEDHVPSLGLRQKCECSSACGTKGVHRYVRETGPSGSRSHRVQQCSGTPSAGQKFCSSCICSEPGCTMQRRKGPHCTSHQISKQLPSVWQCVRDFAPLMPLPVDMAAFMKDPRWCPSSLDVSTHSSDEHS